MILTKVSVGPYGTFALRLLMHHMPFGLAVKASTAIKFQAANTLARISI
jgi:hypothetical protein